MILGIPVDEKSMSASVCPSFGRTPYFLIYDTDSDESKFLDNSAADSPGGAGIKAAQFVVDSKVNVLLTPRCGENAAEVIKAADIKIYKTASGSIADNIAAFKESKLDMLEQFHAGFHGHGG